MRAQPAIIQRHVAVQHLPDVGTDVYVNEQPLTAQPSGRAVFGGLLIAQAISAASATVAPDLHVYSSHSTFLRPVTATARERVVYQVDRTADGQSYATRLVRAAQGDSGRGVYIATISFQSSKVPVANALDYGPPMPDLEGLGPLEIPEDLNRIMLAAASSPGSPLQPVSSEVEASDRRPFGFVLANKPGDCRVRSFVRSQQPLNVKSVSVHQAALAYMSDEILLGMAIYANPDIVGDATQNVTMGATLNHMIHFHDSTARVDDWLVIERTTSWGGNGRVLLHENTWDLKTGRLVMTCIQEALIRLKDEDSKL
ncbi:uncharacterized protein JN550_004216 [Neoarthrinium moseri]|uniref:uncharacterized protein n=1 Tax=Neoarthrinium moseri TaxID=1658444 RepID=UPI001FDC78B1|nr:uncharacterized protein JN550_004216 [Neoarthrinium moseri]KAI1872013.1 hypothetical protein JN550_004216 [Neoarthrinium moseri]